MAGKIHLRQNGEDTAVMGCLLEIKQPAVHLILNICSFRPGVCFKPKKANVFVIKMVPPRGEAGTGVFPWSEKKRETQKVQLWGAPPTPERNPVPAKTT